MCQQKPPLWSLSVAAALAVSMGLSLTACRGADPELRIALARQHRHHGEPDKAMLELTAALRDDANHAAARLLLGELYMEQGEHRLAEKHFRHVMAIGKDDGSATLALARALLARGAYQDLLDDTSPAMGPAQHPALLALRGAATFGLGNVAEASAMLNRALRYNPDSADALLGLARIAAWHGETAGATALLARALAISPDDTECLRFQGDVLRAAGQAEAAMAAHEKILALRPFHPRAHIDLAHIHLDAGRVERANQALAAAGLGHVDAYQHAPRDPRLLELLSRLAALRRATPPVGNLDSVSRPRVAHTVLAQ